MIPESIGLTIFALLALLLIHKEVLRALGKTLSGRARTVANSAIGALMVAYGAILLSRFLWLLR
jgi:hypothetical protein